MSLAHTCFGFLVGIVCALLIEWKARDDDHHEYLLVNESDSEDDAAAAARH